MQLGNAAKNLQRELIECSTRAQEILRKGTNDLNKILLIHTGGTIGMITENHARDFGQKHAFRDYLYQLCENPSSAFSEFRGKIDVIDCICITANLYS